LRSELEEHITHFCSICGKSLDPDEEEEGICRNCQSSIIIDDDIEPNV